MRVLHEGWRWLGVAALGSVAATAVPILLTGGTVVWPWVAAFALGAICMARRSVTHQVVGQGIALTLTASHAGAVLVALSRPALFGTLAVQLGLAGIVATLAGLPFWRSAQARERFAPLAYRPWFLAGAVGSVAIGVRFATLALRDLSMGHAYFALLGSVLAAMLIAQATAVARMRAWGVFLATATGAGCVVPAWVFHGQDASLTTMAILVSACLVLPVLAARRRVNATAPQLRVGAPAERHRVEVREEPFEEEDGVGWEHEPLVFGAAAPQRVR